MNTIKKMSYNELSETLNAVCEAISILKKDYLHVSDYLKSEIKTLENKRAVILKEYERRENLLIDISN